MASSPPLTQPSQWSAGPAVQDSFRGGNRGFIPPPRNQHQRVAASPSPLSNEYNPNQQQSSHLSPPAGGPVGVGMAPPSSVGEHPQPRPPLTNANSSGHNRVSSFFSFRKHATTQNDADAQRPGVTRSLSAKAQSNGYQVSEFGRTTPQPEPAQPQRVVSPISTPQSPQQSQLQPTRTRTLSNTASQSSMTSGQPAPQTLHPEIRSIVQLTIAHAHKIYFSGPLIRRIERQPDGQRPHKDEGWTDVWAQLGGTTLSIWDMKKIEEANKHGREVPPTYVNITDAFVQVLGSVTVPATPTSPPKRYLNVITLNTAGSNLILFSCPSTAALISWASALRLSAWEKSRLEEMYTAHLLRITLKARDLPTTLLRGKMEGWVRLRLAGHTDWQPYWMVVTSADVPPSSAGANTTSFQVPKKRRMSSLFSRSENTSQTSQAADPEKPVTGPRALITLYPGPKPKDKKKAVLTISDVTQAFAVYPERPELISRSTLIKVEGTFGDDEVAGAMRLREGFTLIMPELEGGLSQSAEMLKWVVALHDAFELYGRPQAWTWDPRDPNSLMFAYPVGPHKDLLFLDREVAESLDPREDRTSAIRSKLLGILAERMKVAEPGQQHHQPPLPQSTQPGQPGQQPALNGAPSLPPIATGATAQPDQQQQLQSGQPQGTSSNGFQLPPLNFDAAQATPNQGPLPPIKEQSHSHEHSPSASLIAAPDSLRPPQDDQNFILGDPNRRTTSPIQHGTPSNEASALNPAVPSKDSFSPSAVGSGASFIATSRFNSDRPSIATVPARTSQDSLTRGPSPANIRLPNSPIEERKPIFSTLESGARSSVDSNVVQPKSPITNGSNTSLPNSSKPSSAQDTHRVPASPKSINASLLTSPHSPILPSPSHTSTGPGAYSLNAGASGSATSLLTSPHSVMISPHSPIEPPRSLAALGLPTPPQSRPSPPRKTSMASSSSLPSPYNAQPSITSNDSTTFLAGEAGALYYMQQVDSNQPRKLPLPSGMDTTSDDDSDTSEDEGPGTARHNEMPTTVGDRGTSPTHRAPPRRQGTPMAFVATQSEDLQAGQSPSGSSTQNSSPDDRRNPKSRPTFGRKPSGARAPAKNRLQNHHNGDPSLPSHYEHHSSNHQTDDNDAENNMNDTRNQENPATANASGQISQSTSEDANLDVDALAALSYLTVNDEDVPPAEPTINAVEPLRTKSPRSPSSQSPPPSRQSAAEGGAPFKSSFAPSKQAAERKAKAQAQQAAHQAAVHKPGRANGKRKSRMPERAAWNESSDEEEEEDDDEEDEDADSDAVPSPPAKKQSPSRQSSPSSAPRSNKPSLVGHGPGPEVQAQPQPMYPHLRPPRSLPQVPGGRLTDSDEYHQPQPRRIPSDARTYYDDGQQQSQQLRPQSDYPQLGAPRQSVWSQVLDPGRNNNPPDNGGRLDTFIQLEPPSQTMTKAFTPQGLLSAGMQDKQDRSAKRQEELARETGASLINVPNKPPPPQTGLLGAITAHERERKREGGVGAALTEREREKRLAEERQRRFDEQQRQQLDQMQQGGPMFGGQYGYNPMMNPMMMGVNPMMGMNPMMTGGGLNPMMTGGGMSPMMTGSMGYGGMMGGYNPQHMFAAQQAAQAYQQAMMAFSVAGSQAGGEGANANGGGNPMMGAGMASVDPRMSMMSMNMMGPMGMGMGPNPMQMQMTGGGMSAFDPRFPPNMSGTPPIDNGLAPPSAFGGQNQSSGASSPARNGSPLARPSSGDPGRLSSRPSSPKQS